jgi:hypothetical protein
MDYSLCGKSVWHKLPRKTRNIYVFDVQACWRIHVFGGDLSGRRLKSARVLVVGDVKEHCVCRSGISEWWRNNDD